MFTLLRTRSERNSYPGQVIGTYAYTTGAQRQLISVCSHLGVRCSYPTITGTGSRTQRDSLLLVQPSAEPSEGSSDLDYEPPSDFTESDTSSDTESVDSTQSSSSDSSSDSDSDSDSHSNSDPETNPEADPQSEFEHSAHTALAPSSPVNEPIQQKTQHSLRRGLLQQLSDSSRHNLCRWAQAPRDDVSPLGNVYDNTNFMFRVAEQIS